MKPRERVSAQVAHIARQAGGPDDVKRLEARMMGLRDNLEGVVGTASLVNYASAPLGAKKYDSNTLAGGGPSVR